MRQPSTRYADRTEAGRLLAARLAHLGAEDVIVLALPRGGVPVAAEIARALHAPLDVLNVRKLGVPWNEELAMGAIATGGIRVLNEDVIRAAGITAGALAAAEATQARELARREQAYRGGRPAPSLRGRTVVLVDDGIATGATARAAIAAIRAQDPARLVLAVPVAQATTAAEFAREVDEIVCPLAPRELHAIGLWYDDFAQLGDGDVQAMLARAELARADARPPDAATRSSA